MRILLTILSIITLQACIDESNNTQPPKEIPGVWMDRGIQCFTEIEQATFNLDDVSDEVVLDIAKYLDLEFGAPQFSKSIDASKIIYIGKYPACNKTIKIWEYPCGENNHCYVGIQPWNDTYYTATVNPEFKL